VLLRMEGICKRFPGVVALDDVTMSVAEGQVHALVGENGAGKSTLIKILAGAYVPDVGKIIVQDRPYDKLTPALAHSLGIHIIYQEFNLVPSMTVSENIFLGREKHVGPWLARSAMWREASQLLDRVGAHFSPDADVAQLSVIEQQLVEIAKGLLGGARVMVLDEPSAVLAGQELQHLFGAIESLIRDGVGIIYVSHRLEEVFQIANEVTVLKDGRKVAHHPVAETNQGQLIREMVGRELVDMFPPATDASGAVVMETRNLRVAGFVQDATFELRAGEVVGLAGMAGSGRTTLVRGLFGAAPIDGGEILLSGRPFYPKSPADAMAAGIALVPEDRKRDGVLAGMNITRNVCVAMLRGQGAFGLFDWRRETRSSEWAIENLRIRPPNPSADVARLSGGNQQKVILGRWLLTKPKVVMFDEPTRGIDVGAKQEIYQLVRDLTAEGAAVLAASSDLLELIGLCDRVLVMRDGRIAGQLTGREVSEQHIMEMAVVSSPQPAA